MAASWMPSAVVTLRWSSRSHLWSTSEMTGGCRVEQSNPSGQLTNGRLLKVMGYWWDAHLLKVKVQPSGDSQLAVSAVVSAGGLSWFACRWSIRGGGHRWRLSRRARPSLCLCRASAPLLPLPPHLPWRWKHLVRLDLSEVTFDGYRTGRIPALHFHERCLLACLQLCAKSTLIQCWQAQQPFMLGARHVFFYALPRSLNFPFLSFPAPTDSSTANTAHQQNDADTTLTALSSTHTHSPL
jgi:hypothetical protein